MSKNKKGLQIMQALVESRWISGRTDDLPDPIDIGSGRSSRLSYSGQAKGYIFWIFFF